MRRQLSSKFDDVFLYRSSTFLSWQGECNSLRYASSDALSRSKSLTKEEWDRSHRRHRYNRRDFCHLTCYTTKADYNRFHQDVFPSFDFFRTRYFSNAPERIITNKDREIDSDSGNPVSINTMHRSNPKISMDSDHLFVEDQDSSKVNYINMLKSWYFNNHGISGDAIQNAFHTEMIQNPNSRSVVSVVNDDIDEDDFSGNGNVVVEDTIRQIFTASFTCPLTNERYEAGRLMGHYDMEEKNFYSRKKLAMQAVSAVVLRHKMNAEAGDNCGAGDDFAGESAGIINDSAYSKETNTDQHTFRQILQRLYMKHFKISPTQSQSKIIKQDFVGKAYGGTWWTAEFTCPITGRIFDAVDLPGEIVPESMKIEAAGQIWYRKKTDSIHASASNAIDSIDWNSNLHALEDGKSKTNLSALQEPEYRDENKNEILRPVLSWYNGKHENENSAITIKDNFIVTEKLDFQTDVDGHKYWTASFVCPLTGERFDSGTIVTSDAISHTEIDEVIWYTEKDVAIQAASRRAYDALKYRDTGVSDPRFCKEDPSEPTGKTSEFLTTTPEGNDFDDADDENDDERVKQCEDTVEQDKNDFIIEIIPQQICQSPNTYRGSSRTLDAIAEAWFDTTGVLPDKENLMENFQNGFSERERAISRASEWLSHQVQKSDELPSCRTQFDIEGEMCNLKIANIILSSLADCHQRVPFDSKPSGIEECAAAILECMWSTRSTTPDAESYALYLKCLEGETPGDVIEKAQKIVDAMESGRIYNKRSLPRPNSSIYNSLFELKALSGFNSLIKNNDINSLDRNTHLYKLSAMAHDPNTFDIDSAMGLIDEMKYLSDTNDERSLLPDIEVYNAPLRWSGGHLWSRRYSRVIPWDSYREIYNDGFKLEPVLKTAQEYAEKVQRWVKLIETTASIDNVVTSNIETYESLIQAWVRCGNKEGVYRAEMVAKNIITGIYPGIKPRIQTFYPILAAWTYSGCEEGPRNVESWIDLLQESVPKLELRRIFPNIIFMAHISFQRQILNQLSECRQVASSSSPDHLIFDCAMKCSKLLNSAIDVSKGSQDSHVECDIFELTINAWYNAACQAISNDNLEETRKCLSEIEKVVDQFDDVLVWLYKDNDSDEAKKQFLKVLKFAPSIYGAQTAALNTVERNFANFENVVSKEYDRTMHLIKIEEKIRRLEEFHQFWGDNDSSEIDRDRKGHIDFDATSLFPIDGFVGEISCSSWFDFMGLSLDFLENAGNNSSIGEPEFIRLSLSIARVTSCAMPTVLNSREKDFIIDKIVNLFENYHGNSWVKEPILSTVIKSFQNNSITAETNNTGARFSTELKNGINHDPKKQGKEPGAPDTNTKSNTRANETITDRSSCSRLKISNYALRKQPHHHRAKII